MIVLPKPNFPPYVCVGCGVGTERKWFVDLQVPLDNYFNPVNDGAVWYCNECWEGITQEVAHMAQVLVLGQEPWQGAEPTFNEEDTPLILSTVGINDYDSGLDDESGVSDSGATGTNQESAGDSGSIEDVVPDLNADNDDTSSDGISEFNTFFGKRA
jgi:hypothetical protein